MSLSPVGTSNTPSQIGTSDVGIKITKPGFSAQSASDTDLVFSSAWPSLPIGYETIQSLGTLTSTGGSSGTYTYTYTHNLGFAPFSKVWFTFNGLYNTTYDLESVYDRVTLAVDTQKAIISINLGNDPLGQTNFPNVQIHLCCYVIDLNNDVDYPSDIQSVVEGVYDPNYGIKISKTNKSAQSTDLRDYVLHSRCQSPLILAVKTQATSQTANTVQYVSSRSYRAWVYGYIQAGSVTAGTHGINVGGYFYAPYHSQSYPRTFTDGITSYIQWTGTDTGATLVMLRDPMFAPTIIQASY